MAFYNCSDKLKELDFPLVTSIAGNAFALCKSLTTVILRKNSVCELTGTGAFTDTPIGKGTGYIYVPSALVDSYKTATNWSTYADQFRALESYTIDGTTTGALDPTKVNA